MQVNGQIIFSDRKNSCGTKLFKLPIKKLNIQSRNINNYESSILKSNNFQKGSLYSTKETTPRKELNKALLSDRTKDLNDPLDDSLSNITEILNRNKKNLNYADLVGKIPGISNEPNYAFDQMLYNKSKLKKAKKLAQKIGVLKLPIKTINNFPSKEALPNSDRIKRDFSKEIKGLFDSNKKERKKEDDNVEISCCFFGRK